MIFRCVQVRAVRSVSRLPNELRFPGGSRSETWRTDRQTDGSCCVCPPQTGWTRPAASPVLQSHGCTQTHRFIPWKWRVDVTDGEQRMTQQPSFSSPPPTTPALRHPGRMSASATTLFSKIMRWKQQHINRRISVIAPASAAKMIYFIGGGDSFPWQPEGFSRSFLCFFSVDGIIRI